MHLSEERQELFRVQISQWLVGLCPGPCPQVLHLTRKCAIGARDGVQQAQPGTNAAWSCPPT